MALPAPSMRELLEAGVHFGHTTRRWNPKMSGYIFGIRNGVHILDLEQTVPLLHQALSVIRDVVAGGGRVLFVGTKRQASDKITEAAKRCGQYYVNHRWLGGMLTNWKTISQSIRRLRQLDDELGEEEMGLTKKELLKLTRERNALERALGGIKEMGGLPDLLFVVDTNKEHIAINEAKVLNIPVVAIVDSNSNPDLVAHPIPGNDDAIRAISLYCDMVSDAVLEGIQAEVIASGGDVGEAEEGPVESIPAEVSEKEPMAEPGEAKSGDAGNGTAEAQSMIGAAAAGGDSAGGDSKVGEQPAAAIGGETKDEAAPAEPADTPAIEVAAPASASAPTPDDEGKTR